MGPKPKQVATAEVVPSEDGGWYWHVKKNGNVLFHSEVYARRHRAEEMKNRTFGFEGQEQITVVDGGTVTD